MNKKFEKEVLIAACEAAAIMDNQPMMDAKKITLADIKKIQGLPSWKKAVMYFTREQGCSLKGAIKKADKAQELFLVLCQDCGWEGITSEPWFRCCEACGSDNLKEVGK